MSIALVLSATLLSATPSPDWRTLAERSNYTETPRYEQTFEYFQRLDQASEQAKLVPFGSSPEGRTQYAFVIASGGEFTPELAQKSGKPVLLIQACIHAGENEGKDVLMALSREWLVEAKQKAAREKVILLLLPIFNVDGHERFGPYSRINQNGPKAMGWRTTAQNFNLNRDFVKAEAPEMRAWLKLWNAWNPALLVDMHNTDGADYQYHLTHHFESHASVHPDIVRWQTKTWLQNVVPATEKQGFIIGPYVDLKEADNIKAGILNNFSSPRFSAGFGPAVNRPALLLETHMMKDFKTRVEVNEVFLRALLDSIGGNAAALTAAVHAADRDAANLVGKSFVLNYSVSETSIDFPFKGFAYSKTRSDVSGGLWTQYDPKKPETWTVPYYDALRPTLSVELPAAYLVPRHWLSAITLLRRHGVQLQKIAAPATIKQAQTYRFSAVTYTPQPFEGRVRIASLEAKPVQEDLAFASGSVIVRMDQRLAPLIAHMLEPLSPDSIVRQGLGDGFMSRAEYAEPRVLEAKARELLARDPKLQAEFEANLADPLFAGSAQARLNFFYTRLPNYDVNYLRYPVAKLTAEQLNALKTQ
jgi:murein tripeptide amidase MpaA